VLTTTLFILALVVGFYVAWNIGANDVANAVGPAVGSGAMTLSQAVWVAAIFEFAGAFLLGGHVSETLESGMFNNQLFIDHQSSYILGMLSALIATGVWLQVASYFGWPVSTTHTVVGGVIGFGAVFGGTEAIQWGQVGSIALSWIVSPLLGGAVAYLIFSWIRRKILYHTHPLYAARKYTPFLVFSVFFTLLMITLFNGLKGLEFTLPLPFLLLICLGGSGGIALITYLGMQRYHILSPYKFRETQAVEIGLSKVLKHLARVEAAAVGEMSEKAHKLSEEAEGLMANLEKEREEGEDEYAHVEKIFVYLQILIACFMAFAHGSNDVANAIGPLSAVLNGLRGIPLFGDSVSVWLLLLGGFGIVLGLATWGWRVIQTIGKKITALTPSRGFAAGFGASLTIVLASKLGLPISTTHVLVGAILGVGFARGIGAINLSMVREIVISWIVTLPAGAGLTVCFFYFLQYFIGTDF
jgi:inorganic phosphate transporter, PiT family